MISTCDECYIVSQAQDPFDLLAHRYGFYHDHWKPATHCNYRLPYKTWCTRPWCPRHGQYQRIEHHHTFYRNLDRGNYYAGMFAFDAYLWPEHVTEARRYLFEQIKRIATVKDYCWTLEFKNFVPHLNVSINLCYRTLPSTHIKEIWNEALARIGIPDPSTRHVWWHLAYDLHRWTKYMYKTKQVLTPEECPYQHKGWKHSYEYTPPE